MPTPLHIFLLQIIVILIASRVFAWLCKKIGQPAVIGETVAGIILGPSLISTTFPSFAGFVFPKPSLGNLQMVSQVGLILFMFVIGMELDINIIRRKARSAVVISITSIVLPFALGAGLAYYLYNSFAPKDVPLHAFALFMGIAMSITAFPVLARIIRERGITNTKSGVLALTSAAMDDVTGWCLLAFVIAIAKSNGINHSFYTLAEAVAYVLVMFLAVKPLLKRIKTNENNTVKQSTIAIVFILLLASAFTSEAIGIHALFGAFLVGIIMPVEWELRKLIINKIEDVSLILLLPIFFVLTGLRTQIGLLNDPSLWGTCLIIIAVAITGKFGGSFIAAKLSGEGTYESLAIGTMMNTRGLMELIILNIGYDLGILTPQIFTMMVLMALITTFLTSPVLNLLNKIYKREG